MSKLIFSVLMALGMLFIMPTYATAAETVVASWYGHPYHGRKTASGEKYNMWAFTAAHRTLPFGTKLRVTYKDREVVVTINDRGPFVKGRSLDLSKAAAEELGCDGICRVTIERL